ncbi:Xaa-Pro peptidase family protein [Ancylobacter sp. WKF20]|uniref:M24 family metallopeptidase n=1 Tax=Ancylobacter sp. WKF20 TaxID=3039801 RepID=UPI0024345719|nr:Xaa-Pro peptidase family protein [Ancylobacter sp. WKF20]WGD32207.1 Xaa-Pro peptidase family protein [Ancylobacter sp. WKF20]
MTAISSVVQGQESAFPKAEYDARVARAREGLVAAGLDAMVVTGPENIFYLTGQQTPGYYTFQALVLPVEGDPVFIVRQLEYFNFVANTFITDAAIYQDTDEPVRFLVAQLEAKGLRAKRVGIDKRGWFLPITTYEALLTALGTVHDAAGVVEKLRMVKSPLEVEKLVRAATYVDAGMRAGLAAMRVGNTENDLVAAMMGAAIAAGSEYMGMEPLVSSGPRSGVPHGTWKRRELTPGDAAFIEMAAVHDRYHAALMRSAWIGTPPVEAVEMMKVCQDALAVSLEAIKPGVACEVPHIACQKVIDAAGYTDNFRKRLGYSVGISFAPDWGEGGILSLNAGVKTELQPGMAFHLPPALRIYGRFTVGVSETIVVTETGCQVLGTLDRALHQVAA